MELTWKSCAYQVWLWGPHVWSFWKQKFVLYSI